MTYTEYRRTVFFKIEHNIVKIICETNYMLFTITICHLIAPQRCEPLATELLLHWFSPFGSVALQPYPYCNTFPTAPVMVMMMTMMMMMAMIHRPFVCGPQHHAPLKRSLPSMARPEQRAITFACMRNRKMG